jgi:hypothetical protein
MEHRLKYSSIGSGEHAHVRLAPAAEVLDAAGHNNNAAYMHAADASAEALADFIDYQYGSGLRILPAAEMDAKWTPESEIADTAREKACRERESNPYALTSTAP